MITSDITEQLYGKDVFFSTNTCNGEVNAGDQVRFSVRLEPKGPAADLVVKEGGMGAMQPMHHMPVYQHYPPAHHMQMMASPKGAKGASKGAKGGKGFDSSATYFGAVKKFDDTKGWGHIECER